MKSLVVGIAIASLLAGEVSSAQNSTGPANLAGTSPGTGTSMTTTPSRPAGATGASASRGDDTSAASGNTNQAVATTSANALQPAKGSNSFTMGEAQSRLEKNGFANVSGLKKDDNGVWRGTAQKDGAENNVWLDYKGNTGVSQ